MDSKQLLQKLIEKLSANPTADTKKQLQKLIEQVKTKQFREGEAKGLTETIGEEIVDQLQPTFESLGKELTKNISTSVEKAIKGIKVDVPTIDAPKVSVNVPDVIVPPFPDFPEIPTPQVTVNVPPFPMIPPFPKIPDFPKIEMPETMKVFGQVEIANNDYKNPLMVQLIDLKGRPYESVGGGSALGGGVKINNLASEPIPVTITTGASATSASNIVDSTGVAYTGSNPLPITGSVTLSSESITLEHSTDSITTLQLSGSIDSVYVTGVATTLGANILDSAGNYRDTFPVSISGATGSIASALIDSSGIQYSGTNPFPVVITSGASATSASNIVDSSGVAYSGSNPVPVTILAGAGSTTAGTILNGDGTYRDTFPISGTITGITNSTATTILNGDGTTRDTWGVNITGATGSLAATILNGDGTTRESWGVTGTLTGITNTIGVVNVDGTGVGWTGSNPFPVTLAVSNATSSMNVSLVGSDNIAYTTSRPVPVTFVNGVSVTVGAISVDSSGVGYSGSNPIPIKIVAGTGNSTVSVGVTVADAVDDGSAPIKNGGIARTANPTAVAGGDIVTYSADDLGRQICRPVNARDLIATAYVSKATGSTFGTETTLLAATAGAMYDLIYVMGTNDSSAGIQCDLRGITAGNVIMSLYLPPTGTAGIAMPVPLPQTTADTGNAWTIDLPDVTGTNVIISALFTKEI